jgi:hypothetical protein
MLVAIIKNESVLHDLTTTHWTYGFYLAQLFVVMYKFML